MKRIIIVLVFTLCANVGLYAQLSVTTTGDNNTNTAAQETIPISPSADIVVGKIALVYCSGYLGASITVSGNTTVMSITDTDLHTWERIKERTTNNAADDFVGGIFITKVVSTIATTDTITCHTGNTSAGGKTIDLFVLTPTAGNTYFNENNIGGTGTGTSYSASGGIAGPLSAISRLWIGLVSFANSSGTLNCATSYNCTATRVANTGTAATSMSQRAMYLVQSVTGDDLDGTIGVSRTWNDIMAAIAEMPDGSSRGTKNFRGLLP